MPPVIPIPVYRGIGQQGRTGPFRPVMSRPKPLSPVGSPLGRARFLPGLDAPARWPCEAAPSVHRCARIPACAGTLAAGYVPFPGPLPLFVRKRPNGDPGGSALVSQGSTKTYVPGGLRLGAAGFAPAALAPPGAAAASVQTKHRKRYSVLIRRATLAAPPALRLRCGGSTWTVSPQPWPAPESREYPQKSKESVVGIH